MQKRKLFLLSIIRYLWLGVIIWKWWTIRWLLYFCLLNGLLRRSNFMIIFFCQWRSLKLMPLYLLILIINWWWTNLILYKWRSLKLSPRCLLILIIKWWKILLLFLWLIFFFKSLHGWILFIDFIKIKLSLLSLIC